MYATAGSTFHHPQIDLNLSSVKQEEENEQVEVKRFKIDTTILSISEIASPVSFASQSKPSVSSFSSFSSCTTNSNCIDNNNSSNNYLSQGFYDFSIETMCPPIVSIKDVLLYDSSSLMNSDNDTEIYDNLASTSNQKSASNSNNKNKALLIVRSKSCGTNSNSKKETFL